jgi:hypothetical protein
MASSAEKPQPSAAVSNGRSTPTPNIKKAKTDDKDLDDYFVRYLEMPQLTRTPVNVNLGRSS